MTELAAYGQAIRRRIGQRPRMGAVQEIMNGRRNHELETLPR